jgi:hypothetical protein
MALSNIANEPRREITESLVGIIGFFGLLYGDFHLGRWAANAVTMHDNGVLAGGPQIFLGMLIVPLVVAFALLLLFGVVHLTHFMGEVLSDLMDAIGLDPRPRIRKGAARRAQLISEYQLDVVIAQDYNKYHQLRGELNEKLKAEGFLTY